MAPTTRFSEKLANAAFKVPAIPATDYMVRRRTVTRSQQETAPTPMTPRSQRSAKDVTSPQQWNKATRRKMTSQTPRTSKPANSAKKAKTNNPLQALQEKFPPTPKTARKPHGSEVKVKPKKRLTIATQHANVEVLNDFLRPGPRMNRVSKPQNYLSAFFQFCEEHRQLVKMKNPGLSHRKTSTMLREMWGKLAAHEKAVYKEKERKDKIQFEKDMQAYEDWMEESTQWRNFTSFTSFL